MEGQKTGILVQFWRVGRKEERIRKIILNCVLKDKVDLSLRLSGEETSFWWRSIQNSEVWDQVASSRTRDLVHVHPMFKQEWTLIDPPSLHTASALVGLFGTTFLLLVRFYKCSLPSKLHRTPLGSLGSQIRVRLGPCPPKAQSSASWSAPPYKPVLTFSLLSWNYL